MSIRNEFRIVTLSRTFISEDKDDEVITFRPGINLIEGRPNTGKTTWLQSLNYLLGSEQPAEHYFSDSFLDKYRAIKGKFIINSKEIEIKRDWTNNREKSKIYLDGKSMSSDEFQKKLLQHLNIPSLKYPKTDPTSEIKATTLSFRMHFRHLYRQQKYWSALVDRQPDGEFRSCLLNFLGIADKIYTDNYYNFYNISDDLKKANESFQKDKEVLQLIFSTLFGSINLSDDINKTLSTFEGLVQSNENKLSEVLEYASSNNFSINEIISEISNVLNQQTGETTNIILNHLREYTNIQKEIGKLDERLAVLKKIEPIIDNFKRSYFEKQKLSTEIQPYYKYVKQTADTIDTDSKLQLLCDAINEYLFELNQIHPDTWKHKAVNMVLYRNNISVRINVKPWSAVLGGTDSLYFLLAYHYGLMYISADADINVPGLTIIDLPPDIQGQNELDNSFVIKPFSKLLSQPKYHHCQIVFAGHHFNNLQVECNKIALTEEFL